MRNFKKLDLFSPKIGLYFDGQKRFFSPIGFIMTTMFLLEIFGFGIYFFVQFLREEQTIFSYSKELKHRNLSGDLSQKVFFYSVRDFTGSPISSRVLEGYPIYWMTDNENGVSEDLVTTECIKEEINFDLIDFDPSKFYCLSRKNGQNITITNNSVENKLTYLTLYFAKCKNTTENGNHCLPEEEIDQTISKGNYYLYLYVQTYSVDNYSKTKPILSNIHLERLPLYHDLIYAYYYNLRRVIYESDEGILVSHKKTHEDFGLDPSSRVMVTYPQGRDFYAENMILGVQITMDNTYVESYKRSYQKIQSVAANIGGIGSIGYFISELMTFLFCRGSIILAINNAASKLNKEEALNFDKFKEVLGVKPKINGYLKPKTKVNLINIKATRLCDLGKTNISQFRIIEVIFYRCWKKNVNCKYLRDCEKCVKRFLDVKNIIHFWKEFDNHKMESFVSQKCAFGSAISNADLLSHYKTTKGLFPSKEISEFSAEKSQQSVNE